MSAISQLAWVVADLDAAESALGSTYGVVAWTRIPEVHFGPDGCTHRGAPADFVADISLAYAGELQLEIIRPVRGESIYTEFLATSGPGLHHTCREVDDLDAAVADAIAEGREVIQAGTMAGMRFAYVDLTATGAGLIELAEIGSELVPFYDHIRARSEGRAA
ncbi:VOC family protein [Nocardioides caeni]|uniref:VOC family protein n=1 Tax=Nocardioides caeni TaxID=574700 RepID=A0A4S8MZZ1_9ACTN|nr:VOC family protein [Nocardioides caeni]THV08782.1 VOC family protein [Nocardioides caeni]